MNILINLMTIVSLTFSPLFIFMQGLSSKIRRGNATAPVFVFSGRRRGLFFAGARSCPPLRSRASRRIFPAVRTAVPSKLPLPSRGVGVEFEVC